MGAWISFEICVILYWFSLSDNAINISQCGNSVIFLYHHREIKEYRTCEILRISNQITVFVSKIITNLRLLHDRAYFYAQIWQVTNTSLNFVVTLLCAFTLSTML